MTTKNKLTVCVPTYSGEAGMVEWCVYALQKAWPQAGVHILDDKADPLPRRTLEALPPNVDYRASTFDRKRNLNGTECVRGLLREYLACAETDGNADGYIFKIDPDTLVLRGEHVLLAMAQGSQIYSVTSEKGLFSGACYGLRVPLARRVLLAAEADGVVLDDTDGNYVPEDCTIMGLAYALSCGGAYTHIITRGMPGTDRYFGAFDVKLLRAPGYAQMVECVAQACRIVTVGNTGVNGINPAWRIIMAEDLVRAREKYPAEPTEPKLDKKDEPKEEKA